MQENRQRYKFQYYGEHDRVTAVVEQKDRQLLHRYAKKHRTCVSKIVQELILNFISSIRTEEATEPKRAIFELRTEKEFQKLLSEMLNYKYKIEPEQYFDYIDFSEKGYAIVMYETPEKKRVLSGIIANTQTEERLSFGHTSAAAFLQFYDTKMGKILQKEGTFIIYF